MTYPTINFLNQKGSDLTIVNRESLHISDFLSQLGIGSLHSSIDPQEVKKRNEIYGLLLNNKELRELISNLNLDRSVPGNEGSFLSFYFNKDERYRMKLFKDLKKFAISLSKFSSNNEIKQLSDFIIETVEPQKANEYSAAQKIYQKIEQATNMQGTLRFRFGYKEEYDRDKKEEQNVWSQRWNEDDRSFYPTIHGYRKNFYGLHKEKHLRTSKFFESTFCKKLGIHFLYKNYMEKRIENYNKKNFYKDYILESAPNSVKEDIHSFILNEVLIKGGFTDAFNPGQEIIFDVSFEYNGDKMKIALINFETSDRGWGSKDPNIYQYADLIPGIKEKMSQLADSYRRKVSDMRKRNSDAMMLLGIKDLHSFFTDKIIISAPKTDKNFKFSNVQHLYGLPEVKSDFEQANKYRQFLYSNLDTLKSMNKTINLLIAKSEKWNIPLSMPTILEVGNIVSFDGLYPVHLIGRLDVNNKKLKASSLQIIKDLPKINGQLVGLTGQNAGGKTVTHETILYNVYLAQAGLPIFGKNFVLNPKEMLGILFLERGAGSTMQLQIRKTKEILDAVDKVAPVNALLVLDEVGTGTSHDAGVSYGKKVLESVANRKVSCIYTTQLSEVAEYVENDLNGVNYQLTKNHTIQKGIGKPDLTELLAQEGMNSYFKN